MEKYCVSIDWLQVYCLNNLSDLPETIKVCNYQCSVKVCSYSTPLWRQVAIIECDGLEYATLCRFPVSSVMDKFGCTIKLANRVLYTCNVFNIMFDLIKVLGWTYKGITRIDLCYDCNWLHGHREVSQFLMDYMFHQPYCAGHIIRSGSRKVNIVGTRAMSGHTAITAMRWGSPCSDVSSYCYNKSLELLEVKDKPWIRAYWERCGLIDNSSYEFFHNLTDKEKHKCINNGTMSEYINTPVWRFEVSIKAGGKDLLNTSDGELFKLGLEHLRDAQYVEELFFVYAAKVFDFRMSTGQENIRNYPKLQVFERGANVPLKQYHVDKHNQTGKTEKMCVNLLDRLQRTYNSLSSVELYCIQGAMQFIAEIGGYKSSIARLDKEATYLSTVQSYKSVSEVRNEYYNAVAFAHANKLSIDVNSLDIYYSELADYLSIYDLNEPVSVFAQ